MRAWSTTTTSSLERKKEAGESSNKTDDVLHLRSFKSPRSR